MTIGTGVVIGASGLVGSAVTRVMAQRGWRITAIVRSRSGHGWAADALDVDGVDVIEDRTDLDRATTLFRATRPQVVIVASGLLVGGSASIESMLDANVRSIAIAITAAAREGVPRVIVFGSGFEYSPSDLAIREDDTIGPTTVYGSTKAAASVLAQHLGTVLGVNICIVRPFSLYGPRERLPRFVPYVIASALAHKPIEMSHGQQVRDYLFVDDLADGIEQACRRTDLPAVLNFSGRDRHTLIDVVSMVVKISGSSSEVRAAARYPNPADRQVFIGDSSRARETLGWIPAHDLEAGLAETIKWYSDYRERWEVDVR